MKSKRPRRHNCQRCFALDQSGRRDLNPRPPEPHSGALPDCATSRYPTPETPPREQSTDATRTDAPRLSARLTRTDCSSKLTLQPAARPRSHSSIAGSELTQSLILSATASLPAISQAQCLDEHQEGGWQLTPTGIVKEETGVWRTPVLEYPHECPADDGRRRTLLRHERQAHTLHRRAGE